MTRLLGDEEDAFGRLLLDALDGTHGQAILECDDGRSGPALGAGVFFATLDEWPSEEQEVFGRVHGRVLDIGCGAGRHALEAQRRGCTVVAIDISPGAVEVSRRRGVEDARLLPLDAVDPGLGRFDTVLLMCGNFGLFGDAEGAATLLRRLAALTHDDAVMILDSVDPYLGASEQEVAYHTRNRELGRMPGQVTLRLRYGERTTPWFDLLNVSAEELTELIAGTGWSLATMRPADPPEYYAVLERAEA